MPAISVVTPTLGRDALGRLLEGLEAQEDQSFELVVGCEEAHAERVEEIVGTRPFPARVVCVPVAGAGASHKRNAGIRAAAAPLILFLDDDVVPRPDVVRRHRDWHAAHPEPQMGLLGLVVWSPEITVTGFMRWVERGVQFEYEGILDDEAGWNRLYTANASIKRDIMLSVDGFDEDRLPYGYEDLDLAKRMHEQHGFRLMFDRDAIVEHLHEMTLDGWRTKMTWLAQSERAFTAKHPEMQPHFHTFFAYAAQRPPANGRGRHLMRFFHKPEGWLAERVWASADIWYRQQLAPDFLREWDAVGAQT
jgi:GT2 family glycosyltransferase